MKRIYLVRHCKADGQEPDAHLTDEGKIQAAWLSEFLSDKDIGYIISSPFERAVSSIRPFSETVKKEIHIDNRLSERMLSQYHMPDWMERLKETYLDLDLKFEGGESSREAMERGIDLIEEVWNREEDNAVVVTHGNLMSLIIKHFDDRFGFEDWKGLTNPDLYELSKSEKSNKVFAWRGIHLNLRIREINEYDPSVISEAFREQGWHKPAAQYEGYVAEQTAGARVTLIAEVGGEFAGYVNVIWKSHYPYFHERHIPEIHDFNVLIKFRGRGIGTKLMDKAEEIIRQRSSIAGIGVGLHSDYGTAQVLYVKRGYIPDGQGIHNGRRYLEYGDRVAIDDDIVLYFTKKLRD